MCFRDRILVSAVVAQTPSPPKPGPEQEAIGFFVGKWSSQGEMKPSLLGSGGSTSGGETCEWFQGGFQLVCRGEGKSPMGPTTWIGIMAYSPSEKAYTNDYIDSLGMSELSTGTKSGSAWTFTATSHYGGKTFKSRYTVVESSPTSYTFKWETSEDGTKWTPTMGGKATKTTT